MKIYTKTGDKGSTSLYGGQRVSKDSARIEAIGNVDELNTLVGVVVSIIKKDTTAEKLAKIQELLTKIQSDLFVCGGDIATPLDVHQNLKQVRIELADVDKLEREIDFYSEKLEPMRSFILPGGSKIGATLHQARAVCRRAERSVVYAMQHEEINKTVQIYLNRLSDLLFILARTVNKYNKIPEQPWLS